MKYELIRHPQTLNLVPARVKYNSENKPIKLILNCGRIIEEQEFIEYLCSKPNSKKEKFKNRF